MIKVESLVGKNATSRSDGEKLYQATCKILKKFGKVALDFQGVHITTSVFLNYSVGQLIKDYDYTQIKTFGLSEIQKKLLKSVIDNAEIFYGKSQRLDLFIHDND